MKKRALLFFLISIGFLRNSQGQYCIPSDSSLRSPEIFSDIPIIQFGELQKIDVDLPVFWKIRDTCSTCSISYEDRTEEEINLIQGKANELIYDNRRVFPIATRTNNVRMYLDMNNDSIFQNIEIIADIDSNRIPAIINLSFIDTLAADTYRLRIIHSKTEGGITPCNTENDSARITIDYDITVLPEEALNLPEGIAEYAYEDGFENENHADWLVLLGYNPSSIRLPRDVEPEDVFCCADTNYQVFPTDTGLDKYWYGEEWPQELIYPTHVIVSQGNDSTVPTLQKVPDWGGEFAIRMGDNSGGMGAVRLQKTLKVDENFPLLKIGYLTIQHEPGHPISENPYIEFVIFDGNGDLIQNSQVRNGDFDKTRRGNLEYSDWNTKNIDLSNYIGADVTIRVSNHDCAQGAHSGYMYFDYMFESKSVISSTKGNQCSNKKTKLRVLSDQKSYLWSTGDTTYQVEVEPELNAWYSVEFVTNEGDTVVLDKILTSDDVEICNSIRERKDNLEIEVYPSPTYGELTISGMNAEKSKVNIIDITGKIIVNTSISGVKASIDVSNLNPGIYWIRVSEKESIRSKRFIKL